MKIVVQKKKKAVTVLLGCFILMLIILGCNNNKENEKVKRLEIEYDGAVQFNHSELIDLYLITAATHFDFQSPYLINENNEMEQAAKKYFSEYKDDEFIKNLDQYVDEMNQCYSFSVLIPLSIYCFQDESIVESDEILSDIFQTTEDFQKFLDELEGFYYRSNAGHFFAEHNYNDFKSKLESKMKQIDIAVYMKEMEEYVGNKEIRYANQNIKYVALCSNYRPFGGSFFQINKKDELDFVCFTSTTDFSNQMSEDSVEWIIENEMHEVLHMYLNDSVAENMEQINMLSNGKNKKDYVSDMYAGMPWNRIVDENMVRAVEARIYDSLLGQERAGYERVLVKEIKWGGFSKVTEMYDGLQEYEEHRDQFSSIEEYIPNLINDLFQ